MERGEKGGGDRKGLQLLKLRGGITPVKEEAGGKSWG